MGHCNSRWDNATSISDSHKVLLHFSVQHFSKKNWPSTLLHGQQCHIFIILSCSFLSDTFQVCLLEGVCRGLTHFMAELSWVYSLAVAATLCWLVCLPISARILGSYLHATKKLFNSHYLLIVNFELNWISPTRKGENSSYVSADPFILPLSPVVFATLAFLAVPFLLEDFLHLLVSKSNGSWWYLGAKRSVWVRKTIPHGEVHVVITNGSGHCLRQPNLTPVERES